MLHVALCTDGVFPHALGGMQRHSRLLAEHLVRTGEVKLTVLHPHAVPIFDPALGITEVQLRDIDTGRFYLRELWHYSGRIARELHRLKPDVVLSQGFSVWKGIDDFSDRLVLHPHGLEMFQGMSAKERAMGLPFRVVLRYLARHSARVVSLGGMLTATLERLVQGSRCRVVVVPNAVELPPVPAPYPAVDGALRLFFVGRFAFNKGIDVLMEVAQRLVADGLGDRVLFELAGSGPLLEHYKSQGLPANVRLLGRVDDDELFQRYRDCHALVLPTRFEGMPTVVLEAMAQARPILVSDVGATAELVDARNGHLLPKGDVDALHAAVLDLLDRPHEQLEAMGIASYTKVRQRFAWPAVTREMLTVMQDVHRGSKA